jgi:hypothetical protein
MTAAIRNAQARQDGDPQDQDKVVLEGINPQDVWVRAQDDGTRKHAEFAAQKSGPWFRHGINWKVPKGSEDSMFITFHLMHVVGIDCDEPVLYSPPFGPDDKKQYCAVPPSDTKVVHHFTVDLHDNTDIDPKIVVTPIST